MTAVEIPIGPAQRRHQDVVVAQGVEPTAEASDAEGHGGDEGDRPEDGGSARDPTEVGPPIGVHREEQGSGSDQGAGVSDRRQRHGAGANSPARLVAPEVEGIAGESFGRWRSDVEHRRTTDAVRVDGNDLEDDGVRAVRETVGEGSGDRLVLQCRPRRDVLRVVVEHTHRSTGQRHRLTEREDDLGRERRRAPRRRPG